MLASLRSRGLARTVQNCLFHVKELWFDCRYGIDTWGVVSLQNLDLPDPVQDHAVHYEPTPLPIIEEVFQALRDLRIRFDEFVFIDLGSGKGRTLLRAARLPFRKVMGVEISYGLDRIARRNVSKYLMLTSKHAPIECIREDAANFTFPAANTVLYLYHPFDKHVLNRVLDHLQASLQQPGSKAYVVYVYPSLSEEIGRRNLLCRVLDRRTGTGMDTYARGMTSAAPFEIWTTPQ